MCSVFGLPICALLSSHVILLHFSLGSDKKSHTNVLFQMFYYLEAETQKIAAMNRIGGYHISVSYTHLDVYKRQERS